MRHARGGPRWFLASALVLTLGVLLWLTLRSSERGSAPPTIEAQARAPEPEPERELAEAPVANPAVEPERIALAPERERDAAAPAAAPVGQRIVLLVEAGSARPVPEAEVWYRAWSGSWSPLGHEVLSELSQHTRADAAGLARIPWPGNGDALVIAQGPGWVGGGRVPPTSSGEVTTLELHPDGDLEVGVLDSAGAPAAGVPVALAWQSGGQRSEAVETTGADGRVALRHAAALPAYGAEALDVRVALPLARPLFQALEPEARPWAPVRFRLPPLGGVDALVLDEGGAPLDTAVELALVWPGEARELSPFAQSERAYLPGRARAGRVAFDRVELGAEVELVVTRPGSNARQKDYFAGPRRAGERVEHTVRLRSEHPVLVFRAVDESGAALANLALTLLLAQRTALMNAESRPAATTDGEGRFSVELGDPYQAGDRRTLRVTSPGGELGVELDLARAFEPGRVDMGDLVLAPAPLLAAGRVTDAEGTLVSEASFRLEVQGADEGTWWQELETGTKSDAEGRFELRAFAAGTRVRLTARAGDRRSETLEVERGTRGVELVVQRLGAVAGSLLLDPDVPASAIVLRLTRHGEEDSSSEHRALSDGTFRLVELLPGDYRFSAGASNEESEFEAELRVLPGADTRDPRLQGIDLRGRLHALRLTLTAEGRHDFTGRVVYRSAEDGGSGPTQWFQASTVLLVTPHEHLDVTVYVAGFRTVELRGVSGERELTLEPSLRVRLVLPAEVELPAPPVFLKAVLAADDGFDEIDWGGEAFDEEREVRCSVPRPGRMRVWWLVERRQGQNAAATTLTVEPPEYVEVGEGGEAVIPLRVEAAALRRALADAGF